MTKYGKVQGIKTSFLGIFKSSLKYNFGKIKANFSLIIKEKKTTSK